MNLWIGYKKYIFLYFRYTYMYNYTTNVWRKIYKPSLVMRTSLYVHYSL